MWSRCIGRPLVESRARFGLLVGVARYVAPLEVRPGRRCWDGLNAVDIDAVDALGAAGSWFDEFFDGPVIIVRTEDVGDVGNL